MEALKKLLRNINSWSFFIGPKDRKKLAVQLIFYILLWSSCITLLITALQLYLDYSRDITIIEEQFQQIEKSHIPTLTKSVWTEDVEQIRIQLEGILQLPYMRYVKLEAEGGIVETLGDIESNYVMHRELVMKHLYQEKEFNVGRLQLAADLGEVYKHLFEMLMIILLTQFVKTFLVSSFMFFIVQQLVIRHLRTIIQYIKIIDLEHLEVPLRFQSNLETALPDEIAELSNGINKMRTSLLYETNKTQKMVHIFEKFVPKQFLTHIGGEGIENIKLGEAKTENITVLFSDIRSFTTLSETMPPRELLNFLNGYFKKMNKPILENHGFIDKFIGDAIMALFVQPGGALTDEACFGVRAAVGMIQSLKEYNYTLEQNGTLPISIGIGLHCGPVVIGMVGSEERMESTVLGDNVNLAARLEGLTKPYGAKIIISSDTFDLLENPAEFQYRVLDWVKVKGKTAPVRFYEIYDNDPEQIKKSKTATRKFIVRGLSYRKSRDWESAEKTFLKALEVYPDDNLALLHLRQIEKYRAMDLPDDWDGAIALDEK